MFVNKVLSDILDCLMRNVDNFGLSGEVNRTIIMSSIFTAAIGVANAFEMDKETFITAISGLYDESERQLKNRQ